jgi:hypothetical protein
VEARERVRVWEWMDELVTLLLWHSHEMGRSAGVWGQVVRKVTPHSPTWDDFTGCSNMVANSPVVSVC